MAAALAAPKTVVEGGGGGGAAEGFHREVKRHVVEGGAYGAFSVYEALPERAAASASPPVLVTLHDAGLNAPACFGGFFGFAAAAGDKNPLRAFRVLHVEMPGQGYNEPLLPRSVAELSADRLAGDVVLAMDALGVRGGAVLMGVGLGACVMARVAAREATRAAGAVLLSPSAGRCSWAEWGAVKLVSASCAVTMSDEPWVTHFLHRFFAHRTFLQRPAVTEATRMSVMRLPRASVWPALQGLLRRSDMRDEVRGIRCPVLVVCGENTREAVDAVEFYSLLSPGVGELVHGFHRGVLATEETPHTLLEAMGLFSRGLGLALGEEQL